MSMFSERTLQGFSACLDPNEDQFEKEIKAKKERVAKNELQRLRNIARRSGKKVPGIGETMTPDGNKSIPQVNSLLDQ